MLPAATDADPVTRIRAIVALHVLVHAESAHPCLCHDLARYACFSRLESGSVIPDGSGGVSAIVCSAQPRATRSPIGAVPLPGSAGWHPSLTHCHPLVVVSPGARSLGQRQDDDRHRTAPCGLEAFRTDDELTTSTNAREARTYTARAASDHNCGLANIPLRLLTCNKSIAPPPGPA